MSRTHAAFPVVCQCSGGVALCQPTPILVENESVVVVVGQWIAQQSLQHTMDGRGCAQIFTTDDAIDVLPGVIDHHCKVITRADVFAHDDFIATKKLLDQEGRAFHLLPGSCRVRKDGECGRGIEPQPMRLS